MATTRNAEPPDGTDAASVAAVGAGVIGLVFTVAALAIFGWRAALSVGAGSAIAVANLVSMAAIIRALLRAPEGEEDADAKADPDPDPDAKADPDADAKDEGEHVRAGRRGGAAWGIFGILKIVVLFGGIWILLTNGLVAPIPLVVGYGVLPLGIVVSSLYTSLAPRSRRSGRRSRTK